MVWTAPLLLGLCAGALAASPAARAQEGEGFDRLRAESESAVSVAERSAIAAVLGRLELEMRLIGQHVDSRTVVALRATMDGAAAMEIRGRPPGWPNNPLRVAPRPISSAVDAVLSDALFVGALARFTDDDERAALERARAARLGPLHESQAELASVLVGRELRLRAPQMERTRETLGAWIADAPLRSDVVVAALDHALLPAAADARERALLLLQRMIVLRQHSGFVERASRERIDPDSGRDPADDFRLEALAVGRFQGWPEAAVQRLQRASVRLGATYERETGFLPEQRRTYPIRPLLDPGDYPLWVALVELTADENGAEPDPGPALVGDADALVAARASVVLAALRHVAHLGDAAVEALAPAALDYAAFEVAEAPEQLPFVAPDDVLAQLRLLPGGRPMFGSGSRRELVDALAAVLDATQARALSIDR